MKNYEQVTAKLQELLNLVPEEDVTNGTIVVHKTPFLNGLRKMYVVENRKNYKRSGEPCKKGAGMSANEFLSIKLASQVCQVIAILIIAGNVVTVIGSISDKD